MPHLIVNRETEKCRINTSNSIIDMLEPGDALVMNDTRVPPCPASMVKVETGGHVELLLLKNTSGDEEVLQTCQTPQVGTVSPW